MNKKWILLTANELGMKEWQVENTFKLLSESATIPFISRYRKEMTGNLDEVLVSQLNQKYTFINEFEERRAFILNSIEQQGFLNDELKDEIQNCYDINHLEDLYLPFKPKKRNKALVAKENGLEPLAIYIFEQKSKSLPNLSAFINDKVESEEKAIQGAKDIIIEWISENIYARDVVRQQFAKHAEIESRVIKTKVEEAEKYKNYFDFKNV